MSHAAAPKLPFPVESRRLNALRSYDVLDTSRESTYDDIARIASIICNTPMALISFVETERQWFKTEIGLGVSETPIGSSICAHAILETDLLVVPDTTADLRFANNPLVLGDPKLKFYAGAVLRTTEGLPLGAVCVLDTVTRNLSESQLETLRGLARQVMMQLELRKLLKVSEETSRYRARLLAAAGHDLRSPLTVASYGVEKARTDATPAQVKYLGMAEEALENLKQGFNRMLSAAGGRSTFSPAAFESTDLGALLDSVQAVSLSAARRKDIELTTVHSRLQVLTDALQLETLLGNLVSNAVKYTPKGGRVLLGCRRRKDRIDVQVIDTGIGMQDDKIEAMFGAFRQEDARSEGLGLGLWIAKTTAEALGIELTVRSAPEKGTAFTLSIPTSGTMEADQPRP